MSRELDAEVARVLFGLTRNSGRGVSPHEEGTGLTLDVDLPLPYYSTSIAHAMQVVEKMRERGWDIRIHGLLKTSWVVSFSTGDDESEVTSYSLPEAICKAALAAAKSAEGDAQ